MEIRKRYRTVNRRKGSCRTESRIEDREQEDRRGNSGNRRTWSRRRKDQVYDEMEDREQKDGE